MPWPLVLLAPEEWRARADNPGGMRLEPGHCAFAPWALQPGHYVRQHLGANYLKLPEPRRAPIVIALPDLVNGKFQIWYPDEQAWSGTQGYHGDGWVVTGDLPKVSITPSINCVGSYHGWVKDGVISDDVEGRTIPKAPTA